MPRPFHVENLLQVGVTRTELYSFNRIRMCWENPHPIAIGTGGSSQTNYSGPRQLSILRATMYEDPIAVKNHGP